MSSASTEPKFAKFYRESCLLGVALGLLVMTVFHAPSYSISHSEARHLLARTGFSLPRPAELEGIISLSRVEAVDFLLGRINSFSATPAPSWVDELPPAYKLRKAWPSTQRQAFNKQNRQRFHELQSWWATEMLHTNSPLTENLVLFWHNHFTSSFQGVKWVPFLYHQNALLRRHALGDFKLLLRSIVTDPAMLVFLDGRRNHAKHPNENFAREFFELFTLGENQGYNETDIREAARAFSGWVMPPNSATAVFRPRRHDDGLKTILGKTGNFGSDDVVSIVMGTPRLSTYIAEKFFTAYIGGKSDRTEIQNLARAFRRSGYKIRALFRATLLSDAFWDQARRGVIIKSPSDTVMGVARLVSWQRDTKFLVRAMKSMGQELFRPPNVKGWPGGAAWITTTTLSARNRFTARLLRDLGSVRGRKANGKMMLSVKEDPLLKIAMGTNTDPDKLTAIMLAVAPRHNLSSHSAAPTERLNALLLDPAFQMK